VKIGIGCDETALALKELLKDLLTTQPRVSVQVQDFGIHGPDPVDYPDIAVEVAEAIATGKCDRGVLLCGTGLGMAIAANKVPGIRAATCHDVYSAERARKSNNAQIITLGAQVVGPELAKVVVASWLEAEFAGGGSMRKVEKISSIEEKYHSPASLPQAAWRWRTPE